MQLAEIMRQAAPAPVVPSAFKEGLLKRTIECAKWGAAAGAALFLTLLYLTALDVFGDKGIPERTLGLMDPALIVLVLRDGLHMALLGAYLVGAWPVTMRLIEYFDTGCAVRIRAWWKRRRVRAADPTLRSE